MGSFFASRFVVPAVVLVAMLFPACDSSSDSNEVRVAVIMSGSGSGSVESSPPFVGINCRTNNGEVSDQCEIVFVAEEGRGTISLVAAPEINTNFSWGSPCSKAEGSVCNIEFDVDSKNDIEVQALFEARTVEVVMIPPTAAITAPGDDGAIFVAAQAVDDNGAAVLGVVYVWEVDSPGIVDVVPQADPRRVLVRALTEGVVIISTSAQGVVGKTAIEIEYTD